MSIALIDDLNVLLPIHIFSQTPKGKCLVLKILQFIREGSLTKSIGIVLVCISVWSFKLFIINNAILT